MPSGYPQPISFRDVERRTTPRRGSDRVFAANTRHLAVPLGHLEPVRRIAHARIEYAGRQQRHHVSAVAADHLHQRVAERAAGARSAVRPLGLAGGDGVACALHALTVAGDQAGSRVFALAEATSLKTVKTIRTVKSGRAKRSKR